MEAALCDYLTAALEPHVHNTLAFDVPIGDNRYALYVPSIVLTHSKKDERAILIEVIDSARPGGGIRRLCGFRTQQSAHYYLIVVARRSLHPSLPEEAYDQLFPLDDFKPLDEFLTAL